MNILHLTLAALVLTVAVQPRAIAQQPADLKEVRAFFDAHCVRCHGEKKQKGDIFLHKLTTPKKGAADLDLWNKVFDQIETRQMPPQDAEQPSSAERQVAAASIKQALATAGLKTDDLKLLAPSRGNWVDHEALFSGKAVGESGTPARVWRVSARSYNRLFARIDEAYGLDMTRDVGILGGGAAYGPIQQHQAAVTPPWGSPRQWDFTDYSSTHRVSSAEIEHHLRNCKVAAKKLLPELKKAKGPIKQVPPLFAAGKMAKPEQVDAAVKDLFDVLFHMSLEPAALKAYSDQAMKDLDAYGSEMAVERLLISALFNREAIYRIEEPEGGVRRGIMAPRHLARAIAYTLTDREPDPELWKAIDEGRLKTSADVRAQVERILNDPAILKPRMLGFFQEYFGYAAAADMFKCDATMTEFQVPAGQGSYFHGDHLVPDTDKLVKMALESDKDVLRTLLTTRKAFICAKDIDQYILEALPAVTRMKNKDREEAAKKGTPFDENDKKYVRKLTPPGGDIFAQMQIMYGVFPKADWLKKYGNPRLSPEPQGPEISAEKFHEIFSKGEPFDANPDCRMGILTQPSWLVAMSNNFDNHPIHRGRWIRERLLGGRIPVVPITVNAMLPNEPHHAMRERMRVTREEYCWKCHQQMDPLGLPFEQYDHFGRYRTQEIVVDRAKDDALLAKTPDRKFRPMTTVPNDTAGAIIDSGDPQLDGPVKGPLEMIEKLANSKKVEQVFVRHVFRYFLGRNETLADGPVLVAAHKAYRDGGGSMKALLVSLLSSDASLIRIRDTESKNP
jgi:mono/diheme cytochrome c family protein